MSTPLRQVAADDFAKAIEPFEPRATIANETFDRAFAALRDLTLNA